tara:strand:+ start:94 stop:1371 length:1278 start_codon:yes stop_codon:yes gene_type:complete
MAKSKQHKRKVKHQFGNPPHHLKKEPYMPRITFCIPSKNNLRYVKVAIESIRKNAFRKDHYIHILVDSNEDKCYEWLMENKDENTIVKLNERDGLYGIGEAYDYLIYNAPTDIGMIFHADMMLGKDADYHAFKHWKHGNVVCSTRIEPPLHPEGPEKIVENFGMWPEQDVEEGFDEKGFDEYVEKCKEQYGEKTTQGCFAPWLIHKKDLEKIGGHDYRFKSAREDSDLFNRMVLGGMNLIQSWNSFVYHLTARGGQFQHGKLTKDHSQKSTEWQNLMNNSTREFIRKWGSIVKHDALMYPIIQPKYDIAFKIKNCNLNILYQLEPWCSNIYTDCNQVELDLYIGKEQRNTTRPLKERVGDYDDEINNGVVVRFDGSELTNELYNFLINLGDILTDSGELGEMAYAIFHLKITSLKNLHEVKKKFN